MKTRSLVTAVSVLMVLILASAAQAMTFVGGPYVPDNWAIAGPGTASVTLDTTGCIAFNYNYDGSTAPYYNRQNWTFSTMATKTESAKLMWTYKGRHSWFMPQGGAELWADGPQGRTSIVLQPYGSVSRGEFSYGDVGFVTLPANKGYAWGAVTSGEHFDYSQLLHGTLTLCNGFDGLAIMSREFSTSDEVDQGLSDKLTAARDAAERDNAKAKAGAIGAYINQVEAQTGKALTADQAKTLVELATQLK